MRLCMLGIKLLSLMVLCGLHSTRTSNMNQLPRLSPAVGGGLPGLPKRKNTNGLVDYALFDINVAVSTTEYRQVPLHVPNYSQLRHFWQGRYDGVNVSVVHELIPYPSNGSGVINCQNDLAQRRR